MPWKLIIIVYVVSHNDQVDKEIYIDR